MRQRVKPWTRWHGGILVPSMSGVGTVTLPVPDAPVIAADTLSSSSIEITKISGLGDEFAIERSLTGSGSWTELTADANFPYPATGLSASTQYYFRSRSRYTGGQWSEYSSVVSDTTEAAAGNEFAHGDLVTITGSGFGSHDLSFAFAGGAGGKFESTANGSTPSSSGGWNFGGNGSDGRALKTIVEDAARGKVLTSTYSSPGGTNLGFTYDTGSSIPLGAVVYMSMWVYATGMNNFNSGQWKIARLRNNDDVVDSTPDVLLTWQGFNGSLQIVPNPSSGQTAIGDQGGTTVSQDAWRRIELEFVYPSSQGGTSSMACRIHNGSSVPSNKAFSHSSGANLSNMNLYPGAGRARYMVFQNYLGNGITQGTLRQDDHYIQVGTRKRVELCNHATYASSTRREIQPLESGGWAPGSVSARINRGAFSNGTYYAHVVDENNTSLGSREIVLVG